MYSSKKICQVFWGTLGGRMTVRVLDLAFSALVFSRSARAFSRSRTVVREREGSVKEMTVLDGQKGRTDGASPFPFRASPCP